jgi:hypothetical protein
MAIVKNLAEIQEDRLHVLADMLAHARIFVPGDLAFDTEWRSKTHAAVEASSSLARVSFMSIAEGRRHLEQLAPYTRYWRAGLPQRRSRNSTPDRGSAPLCSSWAGHRRAERAPAPLLGSLQLVHATGQISYLLIQGHHPSTRNDAVQRHHERAEPTHDRETAGCRSRSNKKHQRGKGKQAGGFQDTLLQFLTRR